MVLANFQNVQKSLSWLIVYGRIVGRSSNDLLLTIRLGLLVSINQTPTGDVLL
jgi:hypothetical protein